MERDVPDTKHTQQNNISSTQAARLTALTTASDQLWRTLYNNMLGGLSLHHSVPYHIRQAQKHTNECEE